MSTATLHCLNKPRPVCNIRVHTDSGKLGKVMEFKIQIFQAWKVIESGLGPGNSWKINQMVAASLPDVLVLAIVYIFWITAFTNWTVNIADYQFRLRDLPHTVLQGTTHQRRNWVSDTDPRPDPTRDDSDPWPGLTLVFWRCTDFLA